MNAPRAVVRGSNAGAPTAHWLWTAVITALPLASAVTSACVIYDDGPDNTCTNACDCYGDCGPADPDVASVTIDTGAVVEADPGAGVGVFLESVGPGEWTLFTTCDTKLTDFTCNYDLFLTADGLSVNGVDLEGGDFVDDNGATIHVGVDTGADLDTLELQTFDGAPVRLEVWLDGVQDGSYVFYVSEGVIRQGLPTNPTEFVASSI